MGGADDAQTALIRMMAVRGGERLQVITYSGDDDGADDKRDYAPYKTVCVHCRSYRSDVRAP